MKFNVEPIFSALILVIIMSLSLMSCNKTDTDPPIIALIGEEEVQITLNSAYVDQGAKVIDETEGDITSKLYVDNPVNTNLYGEYVVTYKAIDNAGNEAAPVYRYVRVINSAYIYEGNFQVSESEFFPANNNCSYSASVVIDSTVNYRISFQNFACETGFRVQADVKNGQLIIPYQEVGDTSLTMIVQGQGTISDSLIKIEYSKKIDSDSTFWKATYLK